MQWVGQDSHMLSETIEDSVHRSGYEKDRYRGSHPGKAKLAVTPLPAEIFIAALLLLLTIA